ELLYISDGMLWAGRGNEEQTLWKWPLPRPTGETSYRVDSSTLVDIQPAEKDRPVTVVAWVGRTVYGLAGPTGLPRWRCEVQHSPVLGSSPAPTLSLLRTDDPSGLPRVLCHWPHYSSDSWSTVCRQAWPTKSTGEYEPPTPTPIA